MASRTGQPLTCKAAGIESISVDVEPRWQETYLVILAQSLITQQIRVLRDPQTLFRWEIVPTVRARNLSTKWHS